MKTEQTYINNVENGFDLEEIWKIYSQSPIPTIIRDMKNERHLEYNEAMHRLTGYTHDELTDLQDWLQKLYPDECYRDKIKEIIEQEKRGNFRADESEITIVRKDGEKRVIDFVIHEIFFGEKRTDLQIIQAIDITSRKRIEEELKEANESLKAFNQSLVQRVKDGTSKLEESENRLKMAMEGAREGLWVIDFIGGKMHFTTRSASILGYSLEELGDTSEVWDKLTHPEDWPKVEKSLKDHFEGRAPYYEAEYRARTKGGGWKWILGHGRVTKKDENGKPIQAIGTHVDITELKHREFKLKESEEKFRSLVENAPFGIVILGVDNRIEYLNPKFTEIFGYARKELQNLNTWLRKAFPDVKSRKKARNQLEELESGVSTGEGIPTKTFLMTCKDSKEKIINIKPVKLRNGKSFITFQDVTARVKAEEELRKRKQEVERKNQELEEVNTALRVLLKQRENDKTEIEERVLYNMKDLVTPYLEKLENSGLNEEQTFYVNVLKSNINEIISPFSRRLALNQINLTPTEIQVANLIKEGKISKEISMFLHISESTVKFHRHNIRRKLDLLNKKANLRSYLQSI